MNSKKNFSFEKGWHQLRQCDAASARAKLMSALGITTRASFCERLRGDVEPKVSEAEAIKEIFAGFGVKDVGGEA
jgi:hypothetical protein